MLSAMHTFFKVSKKWPDPKKKRDAVAMVIEQILGKM